MTARVDARRVPDLPRRSPARTSSAFARTPMGHHNSISQSRRRFLSGSAAIGAAALPAAFAASAYAAGDNASAALPAPILALPNLASRVVPITDEERRSRLARAQ